MGEKTIVSQAKEMYAAFERKTRTSGESFYVLKDGSPEWMTDLIYEVHSGALPEDELYEMIRDSVQAISELDNDADEDEAINEAIDEMEPDFENAKLARWLIGNFEYADQALEEFGKPESIFALLQYAQMVHIREVGYNVVSALKDTLDEE